MDECCFYPQMKSRSPGSKPCRLRPDFYERMLQDPRIARYFDGINKNYLKRVLGDYFCVVAGGPCTYDGVSMKDSHAHLGIDRAAFNALVEHLQGAMETAGVPVNPFLFGVLARITGKAGQIKAGSYELKPDTTPRRLLTQLVRGEFAGPPTRYEVC